MRSGLAVFMEKEYLLVIKYSKGLNIIQCL